MLLKKLVSACLLPFPFGLALIVVGLALLWFSTRQRIGRIVASAGTIIMLLGGYDVVSPGLLRPLERQYPALTADMIAGFAPTPEAVVVLGSGFHADRTLPPNGRLDSVSLARLVEGVRLWRLLPHAKLVPSAGLGQAEAMAETAAFLGVPTSQVVLEAESLDTADEARLLKPLVGGSPFLLVTSAAHMRRSMALCLKQGLSPIAAPTDFVLHERRWSPVDLVPRVRGFEDADRALHEWIGLLWSRLRGTL